MSAAMGRPKLPEGYAKKVYPLRLSANVKAALQEAADKENLPLPDWMRKVLTEAAEAINCNTENGASRTRTDH